MKYILFNPHSGNSTGQGKAEMYQQALDGDSKLLNITEISDYREFFDSLDDDDTVILCGGDGTLNRFVNDTDGIDIKNRLEYFPTGTGNDFAADVIEGDCNRLICINEYISNLPKVTVNGKEHRFINGVGYGIDGYCCEVGDELHRQNKPANYTAIAIKGLLFHFKPVNATVIVDGKEYSYKKVWIAPCMNGRRYGGGMIPTPNQQRLAEDKKLSVMVFHGSGKLRTLMIFPSIFKGEHVKHKKYVEILCGKDITVRFDRPTPLQIDGETILGVEEYTASVVSVKKDEKVLIEV